MAHIRFGSARVRLPGQRWMRVGLGIALLIGGLFWFLPVLGLWMLPAGIVVLSVDFHPIRRFRRRWEVWLVPKWRAFRARRRARREAKRAASGE